MAFDMCSSTELNFDELDERHPIELCHQHIDYLLKYTPPGHADNQKYIFNPMDSVESVYRYLTEDVISASNAQLDNISSHITDSTVLSTIEMTSEVFPMNAPEQPVSLHSLIPAFDSAAIVESRSTKLEIVWPLEGTYRARYKSDYFPQNGIKRRPRYIADCQSKHFITLKLPTNFEYDFENDCIRAALITTNIDGSGHFYSPYKFQIDHSDINIPDENPIYIKLEHKHISETNVRLQLVLIKSKLDQLNDVQPLKPFSNTNITKTQDVPDVKLTPKDLIYKYQLDKSHLAFTLCRKLLDGSYELYPETTIVSSVITESSTSKKANASNETSSADQHVCCPSCAHSFMVNQPIDTSESDQNRTDPAWPHSHAQAHHEQQSSKKKKT